MGSPLPQAGQNRDVVWQGAKTTALPEGFPPHGERTPKPPWQAGWREKKTCKKGLGVGRRESGVILEGRVWRLGWGGEAGAGVG